MPGQDPDADKPKQPPLTRAAVGEQFLEAFIERTSADASQFLDKLTQQTQEALVQRTTMQVPFNVRDGFLEQSMSKWMDKLFNCFESYKHKFNQGAISDDLRVSVQRPESSREVISYNAYREPDKTELLYRGSISTSRFTAIIRGTKDKIEIYLVPAERALAITRTQTVYTPYLSLNSTWQKGRVSWSRENQAVDESHLDVIAQGVFSELIKYTSQGEPAPSEITPVPPPSLRTPAGPDLLGSPVDSENPYLQEFLAGEAKTHSQPAESSPPLAPNPVKAEDYSIVELCDLLLEAVDIEIEKTAQSGTSAFSNLDTDKAQAALRHVDTLKQFRNQVSDLIAAWSRLQPPEAG